MARLPTTSYDPLPASDSALARGVQAGMSEPVDPTIDRLDIPMSEEMAQSLRSTEAARRTLASSEVMPDEFGPSTLQTFGAYFRTENVVGSALSSQSLGETLFPTPASPAIGVDDLLKRIERDGLGAHQSVFEGVDTLAQYEATKADLTRELEDKRIMAASGTMTSVAAMLAAGIIDLPTLLPGAVGVRLGAKGVSVGRAAVGVASGAAIDATATELALQSAQVDRSFEESALSVGGSIILGGMLGSGLHAVARRSIGAQRMAEVEARAEETVHDIALGSPGARSAGAAQVDAYTGLRAAGIDDTKPLDGVGGAMFGMLKKLGDIPGFIGRNARIPLLDLNNSASPAAMEARSQLVFLPWATKGEIENAGPTVVGLIRDAKTSLAEIVGEARRAYGKSKMSFESYEAFDAQVARHLVDQTQPAHPAVKQVAQLHRKLYNEVLDTLIEAKILPESVRTKYGDRYIPMIFDANAIRARQGEFEEVIANGFKKVFREEAEEAVRKQGIRRTQNEEARARIMGVVEKRPVFEELPATVDPALVARVDKLSGELDEFDIRGLGAEDRAARLADLEGFVDDLSRQVAGFELDNARTAKALSEIPGAKQIVSDAKFVDDISNRYGEDGKSSILDLAIQEARAEIADTARRAEVESVAQRRIKDLEDEVTGARAASTPDFELIADLKDDIGQVRSRLADDLVELDRAAKERGDIGRIFPAADRAELAAFIDAYTRLDSLSSEDLRSVMSVARESERQASTQATLSRATEALEVFRKFDAAQREAGTRVPVVNLKTGKPVRETVVISEGAQLERQRIAREQYEIEAQRVKENRGLALSVFDAQTKEVVDGLTATKNTMLGKIKAEHEFRLDVLSRDPDLTPAARSSAIVRATREHNKAVASRSAFYDAQIDPYTAKRRAEKKALAKKYDDELAEAKRIKVEAETDAKAKAQKQLKESTQPLREGIDGLQFVREGKVADDLIDQEARDLAQRWYKSATEWNRNKVDHEIEGFAQSLKKRRTPVPHLELLDRGFVKGQAHEMLEDYVRMAGTDAAVAKVVKKKQKPIDPTTGKPDTNADLVDVGDLRLDGVKAAIREDYDALRQSLLSGPEFKKQEAAIEKKYAKLLESAPDENARRALYDQAQAELGQAKNKVEKDLATQRDRDIENIGALLDALRGNNASNWSPGAIKAAEMASTANYLRLMGGTVVSSLTDPIKIAISTGLGNTVKGAILAYHQMVEKAWDKSNAAAKGMTRATAAMMELENNARLMALADVSNPMNASSDKALTFFRRMSDVFSKASGIQYWNAYWKQVSDNANSAWIGSLAHRGWDDLRPSELKKLQSLRINRDGLELIRQAHEAQPHSKWHDNWPLLDHENWTDPVAARLVRHALDEEVNNAVVTPQSYDRMAFAMTPGGRLIFQFRQHQVSNQMRFVGRQLQFASEDQMRAAAVGTGFVGLVMAGALVDYLKNVTGQISPIGNVDRNRSATERYMDEWRKTPGMALYNALDRSDTIGIAMEGSNIMEKLFRVGPKSIMSMAAGDDPAAVKEASRYRNRHWADALGGPSVGLVNDAVTGVHTIGKVMTGEKISRGDFRGTERLLPGQNIPYVQYFMNAFERDVGDRHSWPNPK